MIANNSLRIIAFGHRKRVGKDTAVKFAINYVRQHKPYIRCDRLSFGDQLERVSHLMFGWAGLEDAVHYHNNPDEREKILPACAMSPRQIWDKIGSMGAEIHPSVWPEMALSCAAQADVLFCPDLRRPREVEYVRMFKGVCVRIDRIEAPVSNHIVDTALADFTGWDKTIQNDGSLKDFNQTIKALLDEIL